MSTASTYLVRALLSLFALALPFASFAQSPVSITAVTGSGQWTTEGGTYTNHLAATVTDSSGNPVSGVQVNFSGPGGSGIVVSNTDNNGQVSVSVTANSTPGGNTVTAAIDGSPQIMTTFGLMTGAAATCSQTNVVTSTADSNAVGTLREAVFDLCPGGTVDLSQLPDNSTITLSSRIYLSQDITLKGPTNGNTITISGNNATRLFFLESGNVTITNLTLANGLGQGGSSQAGGGGAGMGGGIFQNGGSLTMTNVVMSGNQAAGGSGNDTQGGYYGGGGFGGIPSGVFPGGPGGDLGGAGGAGASVDNNYVAGPGGDGAGGGYPGGNGGFGGGGAARFIQQTPLGGTGGFGGGSGEGYSSAEGGYGGGTAGILNNTDYAGGGAGFGGAIFTRAGSLTLTSVAFNNNTASGGGSGADAGKGQGKGGALFIYAGANAHLIDVTFTGSTAADAGKPGIGSSPVTPVPNGGTFYTNGDKCASGFDTVDICGNAATITSPDAVQTAYTGSAFTTLAITVSYDGAAPPDGTQVTFTAPSSGASGTFSNAFGGLSSGIATADFTANGIPGTYQVTATVPGYGTQTFTLTNQCGSLPVTNTNDSGAGSLRAAVLAACPGATIDLTSLASQTITLQSRLYISRDLTIQGPANGTVTIDGGNATRLFFIQSGNVTMTNLILAHGLGQGGNGGYGGGAAGMGGAIFQNGGNVTLTNVSFSGNQAIGGSTSNSSNSAGGGGFGGSAPAGVVGGSGGDLGGAGGSNGSNGGPGAGGGGGQCCAAGGAGGFGGGGGGYSSHIGGNGGFGGGGGFGPAYGGDGGFGGGTGSSGGGDGGGGAGFGGAIFEFSGTLTLNSVLFSANTATGGAGNQNGQAKGGALFVYYGATANLNNVTFSGDAAADAAESSIGNAPYPYNANGLCPGFDTTDICGLVNFGFGSVNIGQTVTQTIPFNILAKGQLIPPAVLTAGSPNLDYKLVSTTCPSSVEAFPFQCSVTVSFAPQYAGERPGAVYFANPGIGIISANALLNGIGVGPQVAFGPGVKSTLSQAFEHPLSVAVDGAGQVFVTDETAGIIYEFPPGGGSYIATLNTGLGSKPDGVALDGANIFYSDLANGSVYELKQPYNSQPILIAGGFVNPEGVAVDAIGNVFVADSGAPNVFKIPASGAPLTTVGGGFQSPTGVAVDAAGNVYVADLGAKQVYKVPADGSAQTTVGSGFEYPSGVAVDAAGDIYVADSGGKVYEVPSGGSAQTIGSGFFSPNAVALDAAGDVFVIDSKNDAAYEVQFSQPPTLTFPTTNVSSTSTAQSVTIENIGNASLVESALAISTNFEQVAGSGTPADCTATTTLLQAASCNLSISFAPTTGGPLTGSALLTNNALNQSPATQSISLKGTGNQPTIAVQVGTSIAGASFSVDSTTYTSTQTFNWVPASSHTIAVTSPQTANGTRYTFTSWSDNGTQSHMVTASAAITSYTASFSTSYLLTTAASPASAGTITPNTASPTSDGYYPANTQLSLTAAPTSAAYLFSNWTGTTSSSNNPLSITLSGPVSETANFGTNPGSPGSPLAYEPFGETPGTPLNGASGSGDSGWAAPWIEQSGSNVEPGYETASANPLTYPGLATTGSYAIGGYAFQSVGRQLNVSAAGPFSSYLANGLIGAAGQTIWVSCLLREDANPGNGEVNAIFLTPEGGSSAWSTQNGIGIGSFGGNWGLQYNNGTPVVSNVPVTPAQTVLLVASITFGTTNQINLYVDPTLLGGAAPATPSAQLMTTGKLAFQSVSYVGGYQAKDTSLSDIQIGASYASVTHTLLTAQTITFSPLTSPVTYPVSPITLMATASSNLPVTFSVLSGPALVNGNTLTITGVGTVMVAANQSGNYLYAPATQVSQSVVVSVAGPPPTAALLAYEPFNEASGTPLNGASGGGDSGWGAAWLEQSGSNVEPGYQIASANPLSYSGLQPTTNYAVGGYAYQSAGRQLNVAAAGPFSSYLSNGLVGASGQTVWVSFLLREDASPSNGQINAVFLTPNGGVGAYGTQSGTGIGYFGASPYWGLQLNNGTPILSTVPVVQGQTVLMVVSITFGATNQVNLYVNPALGASAPGAASAQLTTTTSVAFQSLAYLGGFGTNESSLAAIRFGSTYAAVTPTTGSPTQSTQTISFTAPASPVTYPVAPITLSATASSGLPVTLSVMSGPGSVTGNTLTVTGVGTIVIAANQAGNTSYAPAPQVTQTLVVNPSNGASSGVVLAREPFGETSGTPLNGATGSGDSGWNSAWVEQDGLTAEPGYQIASANPLTYPSLATSANYAIGGYSYQSAGRQLNTAASGPFLSYLSNGLIGASGQTLWLSFLLREDANPASGQTNAVFLTSGGGSGAWLSQTGIGIGYFGTSPYWGLQLNNGAPILSSVPVQQGQAVLMVVSITFGATNHINLYVNPSSLGGAAPATPSAQLMTTTTVAFQSLSYLGGFSANESSLADIIFGSSYDAVTPTQ